MNDDNINDYRKMKKNKELLLFDKGLIELDIKENDEKADFNSDISTPKKSKKQINWFTLYLVLFKNTLSSKNLVPKEELKLRLNIIRKYLPSYHNCPKTTEESNSNSILKKFTYHLFTKNNLLQKMFDRKASKNLIFFDDDKEINSNMNNNDNNEFFSRKNSRTKTLKHNSKLNLFFSEKKTNRIKNDLNEIPEDKIIEEKNSNEAPTIQNRSTIKRFTIKQSEGNLRIHHKLSLSSKKGQVNYMNFFSKNVKVKLDKNNNDVYNVASKNKEFIIRTPNDNEYPLVLCEKRMMNNSNQTYFYSCLNKLNEDTKNEKINTYKKEVTSQILKFNELYYDSKIDDFSQDTLFNEIKSTCDMFINKFNFDDQEEKNLADLDKFL
jgi:hypothetical protein